MALDVFVMPLWRFKAGIFKSPVEEVLGIVPTTISLAGPAPNPPPPWHLRLLARLGVIEFTAPVPQPTPRERYEKARREIDALKAEMSRLTGVAVDWQDVGESVYGEQFHGYDFLRAFAAWCDHRDMLPEFNQEPGVYFNKHPAWDLPAPAKRRFPTLAQHSLYTGYFLPVPFEGVYKVEPFKVANHWEFFHDVASTRSALRELNELLDFVDTLPVREPEPGQFRSHEDSARMVAGQLREICELSLAHDLPVIFYG